MHALDPAEEITGVILAGGRARRMGGTDKGLQHLAGIPLVGHVVAALSPQVDRILICANRHLDEYARLGIPLVPDAMPGYQGPLAGVAAAMATAITPWLAIVPCDAPFLPRDLVAQLREGVRRAGAKAAVAHDGGRLQPAFALLNRDLAPALETYLGRGDRRMDGWLAEVGCIPVTFGGQIPAFANINTPAELRDAERKIREAGHAGT